MEGIGSYAASSPPNRTDQLSNTFIIGLVFLVIGLGNVLQVTVGPALKRRSIMRIKRQLEDMKVMESSADNRKGGKGDKGGSSF